MELQNLKNIILEGGPNNNKKFNDNLKIDSPYKSNIFFVVGIPQIIRQEIMSKIHYNDLGVTQYTELAQRSIFW